MNVGPGNTDSTGDPLFLAALAAAAVLLPADAYAAHVGCFVTAVLLGMMFMVGIGLTSLVKHLLARYVWKVPRTPWLRMFGITWIELILGIAVFALVRTNFWLTVLVYLPFAVLINRALLSRYQLSEHGPLTFLQRFGIFLLLPFSLPLSIQIAGVIWHAVTNLITFGDLIIS